jgi:GNAT superfamily N-acetyltransferase
VDVGVVFVDRPEAVMETAGGMLSSQPVVHNLVLSLLAERMVYPQPGRYWVSADGCHPLGVVFQSPLDFPAAITPMPAGVVTAVVEAIAGAGVALPGVSGEAATAALFAGHWAEVTGMGATPFNGQRIYELGDVPAPGTAKGHLRRAAAGDCELLLEWMHGFSDDVRERHMPEEVLTRRVAAGQFWLWEDNGACSVAAHTVPVGGVTRVQAVYTPPARRGRGYAQACVAALSARLQDAGHRCILYTDLANPVSNKLYRRIGYRAVVECLRYRFG